MLKNVPIEKLLEVLVYMKQHTALCNMEIDEKNGKVLFAPVYERDAINSMTKVELPKDEISNLGKRDLDDLIV